MNGASGPNGYADATSWIAALVFAVKHTTYSSGSASKKRSTRARASFTSAVLASDVGLSECGLPSTEPRSAVACAATSRSGYSALPV